MAASRAIEEEIGANRRAIARLKREIFGVDKTHRSRYIREFNSEFRDFASIASADEVIEEASRRDIVYFGDYHPLAASQEWVLRLMRGLAARGRKVVLALEMLYVHQQDSLDRWMKGAIGEEQFLEAIDYRSEWGFDWRSYRRIFELAKDPFIPIFGIDSERRDNLKYIRRRDRLAAKRIGTIRAFFPEHLILVIVGESHLASSHLPAAVRAEPGCGDRGIVIVQNMDDIYWRLLREGRETAEAVRIDEDRYCIFTAFPMLKYRAYRELIEMWTDGEEVDATTPFFHETIGEIYRFLAGKGARSLIELAGGRRETFEALLPEVQCRATYHAFAAYLRSRRMPPGEIAEILDCLKYDGMRYVPSIHTLLIVKNDPSRAIREAGRFVLHLMRGEIADRRGARSSAEDAFYGAVVEEALAGFAAGFVNPSLNCVRDDPLLGSLDARGAVARAAPRHSMKETKRLVGALRRFVEEGSAAKGPLRAKGIAVGLRGIGPRKRFLVAKALGARLCEALRLSYREGRMTREGIAALFAARLEGPGAARQRYLELAGAARRRAAAGPDGSR
jgi:hypothetical protein